MKNYEASFAHLRGRMIRAGYTIVRAPGPRGGEWGATYRAYEYVNEVC